MKEIQFERIEDKYKLIIETCERIVSEEEAIELMVTLLRANYEVNYLIERNQHQYIKMFHWNCYKFYIRLWYFGLLTLTPPIIRTRK